MESRMSDSILELNRDVESFIVQGSAGRCRGFKDKYVPLQFVHLSDVHSKIELWGRMVQYVNYYEKYISFALHSGDYCGSSQLEYKDCYGEGEKCVKPIYNCVGNHDTEENNDWSKGSPKKSSKEGVYRLLFNHTENWDVQFMEGEYSMTYYKDFPDSNIRLVVLDLYYDIEQQKTWLREVLTNARENGLHVITSMHEPSHYIGDTPDTTFQTANDYLSVYSKDKKTPFEDIIIEFKSDGGIHVCNFAGHHHHDRFGYTEGGVLNCAVECATTWNGWCDGKRERGTRTFDCFNVVSVDTNLGILKLVRVGDNVDNFLRIKRTLCFDYTNKKVIFNG